MVMSLNSDKINVKLSPKIIKKMTFGALLKGNFEKNTFENYCAIPFDLFYHLYKNDLYFHISSLFDSYYIFFII